MKNVWKNIELNQNLPNFRDQKEHTHTLTGFNFWKVTRIKNDGEYHPMKTATKLAKTKTEIKLC
jgi:hypothetical protein